MRLAVGGMNFNFADAENRFGVFGSRNGNGDVGAYTDATHGMTLAAVTLPYYRMILPAGLPKFRRFAVNVWDVDPNGKSDRAVAEEGLAALERWMRELSLVMNISDLGATPGMIEGLTDATLSMKGGYKVLSRREISEVFRESLK